MIGIRGTSARSLMLPEPGLNQGFNQDHLTVDRLYRSQPQMPSGQAKKPDNSGISKGDTQTESKDTGVESNHKSDAGPVNCRGLSDADHGGNAKASPLSTLKRKYGHDLQRAVTPPCPIQHRIRSFSSMKTPSRHWISGL
jgi:hypothetical protein